MFGAHLSITGGLVNALREAGSLCMDCLQVFTKTPRQWAVRPLGEDQRAAWLDGLAERGWRRRGPARTASHACYLINLASPDRDLWRRSAELYRVELERCEALEIPLCVVHPGAHGGERRDWGAGRPPREPSRAELAGLRRVARALDRVHRELPGYGAMTCIETTAGAGTTLGYSFEHLAWIRANVSRPDRVGFCFDTCHVTAAGYDMTTDARAEAVLRRFGRVCGLRRLRVFHLNDSAGAVGSRRDRHAHIGRGACGASCFRAIVNRPIFARVPKILETPKGVDSRGVPWDVRNIRRLRGLVRSRGTGR